MSRKYPYMDRYLRAFLDVNTEEKEIIIMTSVQDTSAYHISAPAAGANAAFVSIGSASLDFPS